MKIKNTVGAEKNEYFGRDLQAMSFAKNYHQWIFAEFKPYFGAQVAEVGAGTGNFTELLVAAKTKIDSVVAFEPSANMYPMLEKRFAGVSRIKTENSFFSDRFSKRMDEFDSIVYVNVLEHIEADAVELRQAFSSLKSKGHVLIFVPALTWLFSGLDKKIGHFRRYHKPGLMKLVRQAGFDIVKVKYFDLAGIVPWYVAYVLLKRSMTNNNVALYDKWVIPVMRRVESILAPAIGKNLLLVGKKK